MTPFWGTGHGDPTTHRNPLSSQNQGRPFLSWKGPVNKSRLEGYLNGNFRDGQDDHNRRRMSVRPTPYSVDLVGDNDPTPNLCGLDSTE